MAPSESEEDEIDIVGEQHGTQPMLVWGSGDGTETLRWRNCELWLQDWEKLRWWYCEALANVLRLRRRNCEALATVLIKIQVTKLWGSGYCTEKLMWWDCEALARVLSNSGDGIVRLWLHYWEAQVKGFFALVTVLRDSCVRIVKLWRMYLENQVTWLWDWLQY